MMGYESGFSVEQWRGMRRLSLAESVGCSDGKALAEARNRRLQGIWQDACVALAKSGTDLRPLLANLPGLASAAAAGRSLRMHAQELRKGGAEEWTQAASLLIQSARLLERAGFDGEAELAEGEAFTCIQDAVRAGSAGDAELKPTGWCFERVQVSAPPRIDLGGGWSDTPPFCFDWGGTVLNCALAIDGAYPIQTESRRIDEAVIRCCADGVGGVVEYRSAAELLEACGPGSVVSIS